MEKIVFTIKVREIGIGKEGKGFIVILQNQHNAEREEVYCLNMEEVNNAVKNWTKKIMESDHSNLMKILSRLTYARSEIKDIGIDKDIKELHNTSLHLSLALEYIQKSMEIIQKREIK